MAIVVITDFVGQLHELGPPSIILVAFFAFTIFRMPTGRAALAVGSYLVAYQILLFLRYTEGTISFVEAVYAGMFACNAFVLGLPAAFVLELTLRNSFRQARLIEWERARSERLLRNMLPDPIARRLKEGEETIADGFEGATVLFADIVGFTAMSSDAGADRVVKMLNSVFTAIDDLVTQHGLLKIKTIGDAYMVAAGIPEPRADHATAVADFALDLKKQVATIEGLDGTPLKLRIGMHSGPVVAGVIGKRTVAYDLWGDCVNTASRMESHGQPGEIQITEETRRLLGDRYVTVARDITVKGKGPMRTFLLDGRI